MKDQIQLYQGRADTVRSVSIPPPHIDSFYPHNQLIYSYTYMVVNYIYFFRRPYDLWKAAYASVFPPEVSDYLWRIWLKMKEHFLKYKILNTNII